MIQVRSRYAAAAISVLTPAGAPPAVTVAAARTTHAAARPRWRSTRTSAVGSTCYWGAAGPAGRSRVWGRHDRRDARAGPRQRRRCRRDERRVLKGTIEDVPLPAAAVDVVISNCVINLSVDKPAVIAKMFR